MFFFSIYRKLIDIFYCKYFIYLSFAEERGRCVCNNCVCNEPYVGGNCGEINCTIADKQCFDKDGVYNYAFCVSTARINETI